MTYILFLISRSTSLFIMTFGRTFYAQLFNKFILPKLAACRFYVKRPKSASFFQVACTVIYSVTCLPFFDQAFGLRKSSSFRSAPTTPYWILAFTFYRPIFSTPSPPAATSPICFKIRSTLFCSDHIINLT